MARRAALAAILCTIGAAAIAPPALAGTSLRDDSLRRIQAERAERGLASLRVAADLAAFAQRHAERMAAEGRVWHSTDKATAIDGWSTMGENVGSGPTVSDVHHAFMLSAGHRAVILDPRFTQIGIGVARGGDGMLYVAQLFVRRAGTAGDTTPSTRQSAARTSTPTAARPPVGAPPALSRGARDPDPPIRTVDVLVRVLSFDA